MKAKRFDQKFDAGEKITDQLDLSKARRVGTDAKRVTGSTQGPVVAEPLTRADHHAVTNGGMWRKRPGQTPRKGGTADSQIHQRPVRIDAAQRSSCARWRRRWHLGESRQVVVHQVP